MANVFSVIVNSTTEIAGGCVVTDGATIECQHCVIVVNATAVIAGVAVGDGETRNGHGLPRSDVEHAALVIAINSKVLSAWS